MSESKANFISAAVVVVVVVAAAAAAAPAAGEGPRAADDVVWRVRSKRERPLR